MDKAVSNLTAAICAGLGAPNSEQLAAGAIDGIFGSRYPQRCRYAKRTVFTSSDSNLAFAGLLHPDSPQSGVYGGMSLIWFPVGQSDEGPPSSLLTFVCGTRGLAPDEQILGRPGHARYLRALGRYIETEVGVPVWVKRDPTNLAQQVPNLVQNAHPRFKPIFDRYGQWIYAAMQIPSDVAVAERAVGAFLDFYAWERGMEPLANARTEVEGLRNRLRAFLFPKVTSDQVGSLLRERRFVILQGPPGTGKTRLAQRLLKEAFAGNGSTIQFHPSVSYESFVAGITPSVSGTSLRFEVSPGALAEAIKAAEHRDYLLLIDEINRADLSKVLGEAIYLFEAADITRGETRRVRVPYELPNGTRELSMPKGLFVVGTMNTADRSIAILDLAVRRRFAFIDIWPDAEVVQATANPLAIEAFAKLQDIFAQYAGDDVLPLLPGHAYFLASDERQVGNRLKYELAPLLREYLIEGRLGACEGELYAYIDWIEAVATEHG